jgi:hypothetical protein
MNIDHIFPIEAVNEAHTLLRSGEVLGKVVLRF